MGRRYWPARLVVQMAAREHKTRSQSQPRRDGRARGPRPRRAADARAQAAVVQGPRAGRQALHRATQADRGRRPPHGLPGGRLPEHRRVLGARHRHLHDPRRHVHPPLRLLPRQDRQADLERPARARSASPGWSRAWVCATRSSRASTATTCPTRARASGPRRSARSAARRRRARSRCSRPTSRGRRCRWRPSSPSARTSSTTTSRSCRGCTPRPPRLDLAALLAACSPTPASSARASVLTKSGLMVGLGETHDEMLGAFADLRHTASTSSRSASTCARPSATFRSCATGTPTSSRRSRRRLRARLHARRRRSAGALQLPRRRGRQARSARRRPAPPSPPRR